MTDAFDRAMQRGNGAPPRYAPSWVDRFTAWVRKLPIPAWLFYTLLAFAFEVIAVAALAAGGMLDYGHALTYYSWLALTQAYLLALIHYLDASAESALARYRGVMNVDDVGFEAIRYRLTTLPRRETLVASAVGALYALLMLGRNVLTNVNPDAGSLHPAVIVLDVVYRILVYLLAATVVYHVIHQLRTVSKIYTEHTEINLFRLGPLYALSELSARAAIGIGLPTYLWLPVPGTPGGALGLSDFFPTVLLGTVMVVTFVWPLLGVHRLLEREKQRLQDEVAGRLEGTMRELNELIDRGELERRGDLKSTLEGLVTQQQVIDRLRTWPWRVQTVSGIAVAIVAPLAIWLIQRLLERLGV